MLNRFRFFLPIKVRHRFIEMAASSFTQAALASVVPVKALYSIPPVLGSVVGTTFASITCQQSPSVAALAFTMMNSTLSAIFSVWFQKDQRLMHEVVCISMANFSLLFYIFTKDMAKSSRLVSNIELKEIEEEKSSGEKLFTTRYEEALASLNQLEENFPNNKKIKILIKKLEKFQDENSCPISRTLMNKPVKISTNKTYDYKNIYAHIFSGRENSKTCPVTTKPLKSYEKIGQMLNVDADRKKEMNKKLNEIEYDIQSLEKSLTNNNISSRAKRHTRR